MSNLRLVPLTNAARLALNFDALAEAERAAAGLGVGDRLTLRRQDAAQAHATATTHRTQWLRGYRGAFGFVCLVLRRTDRL